MGMFRPESRQEMRIGSNVIIQPQRTEQISNIIQPSQTQRIEQISNIIQSLQPQRTEQISNIIQPLQPQRTEQMSNIISKETISTPSAPPAPPAPIVPVPAPIVPVPPPPETSLYPFTAHTFTNAGSDGAQTRRGVSGPTLAQIRSAYSAISWAERFINMNGNDGIQLWTVPRTGVYTNKCYITKRKHN
jgi:hypothetical protein